MTDNFDILANRGEKFIDDLSSMTEKYLNFIRSGLLDDYDVIVSESIDYVIKLRLVDFFSEEILLVYKNNKSDIVMGRLILSSSISRNSELLSGISGIVKNNKSEYINVWIAGADFLKNRSDENRRKLEYFKINKNETIKSLANYLIDFIDDF